MQTQQTDDVVVAEAAAWIARLQGTGRTAAAEAAFREWLAADSAHARAFSRATDAWEVIPGAARFNTPANSNRAIPFAPKRRTSLGLAAGAAFLALAAGIAVYALRALAYTTAVGQQQTIALDDGTLVWLNTNSKLRVDYSGSRRRLRLDRGEGFFEVAKDSTRPFIVQVGEEQVTALGTAFLVRRDSTTVAITLVEGRIEVTKQIQPAKVVVLSPGERVTVRADAGVALDQPNLEPLLAWRRGELVFDDASLLDAVAEINRYGDLQLVVADPGLAELRVSGVFVARDPQEFANTIAQLYKLSARRVRTQIVLER